MGLARSLYYGETRFDFARNWRRALYASGVALILSAISLLTLGVNWGIEFTGGTSWEVEAPGTSVAEARDFLRPLGQADATIQVVDGSMLRIQSTVEDPDRANEIAAELESLGPVVGLQSVGPTWSDEITEKSLRALVVFFILLAGFISWRLEWRMAVGAFASVAHDLLLAAGIYSVLQLPVTPATVVAFLTILGYSLYDTVVVFDKVREIGARPAIANRSTYTQTMNLALNQVIMRTVNTTVTAILPVASLLVVGMLQGADTLLEFAVALLVGLIAGSYSTLFVAAPVVCHLKEREPAYQEIRERLAQRGGRHADVLPRPEPTAAATSTRGATGAGGAPSPGREPPAPAGASGRGTGTGAASTPSGRPATGPIPPRPRKKKRR